MDAAGLSISLAGIVLKLVILSLDFVGDAKQVYKNGATDRNIDLCTVAKSVEDATTSLVKQLNSFGDNQEVLDTNDEQLKELSLRAAEIGRELAQRLRKVTADDTSKWKSFKAAALGMWDAGEIEKTEKRLGAIKDEIQLRILVGIRDKVNRTNDTHNSRILSTLEEVTKQHAGSKEDTKHMIEQLNEANKVSRVHHEELVQLGNQILNGINAKSISGSSIPAPIPRASLGVHDKATHEEAEIYILNLLWYSSIRYREEDISENYANTFQWIFENPETTGKPWGSFVDFLRGQSPSYWITGKPGCGKSTLMKYINDSPKTQTFLEEWTGGKELIKASYYFYYNGGEYQKTEIGMIRSLLYSILEKRRGLIQSTFKIRYWDAIEERKPETLLLPEARRALTDLIVHNPNLNLFISIDGLDEFDPAVSRTRVQSLIDFTRSLEKFSNVKVLVSSRPLPEFELGYNGRPSLSVHHLTQEDIRRYANEKLMNHPRMHNLAKREPKHASDLLHSIVESSLGVFLWVRLVTESLLEGLTNYDSIDDLKRRVDDLPSDIQDLYRTILSRINPKYKPQSARLLCFVQHMHGHGHELTLLDLWFAENADHETVRDTSVKPIEIELVRERVQEIETLLKSRCLGLIESVPKRATGHFALERRSLVYDLSTNESRATARFLHRSVYEFLSREDIWAEVVKKHLDRTFSVTLSLFRSVILIIKTCRLPPGDRNAWEVIVNFAMAAGARANLAELETNRPHVDLVHELDSAMHGVTPPRDLLESCHWSVSCHNLQVLALYQDTKWRPMCDNHHSSLIAFAADHGLKHYIQSQIASKGRNVLVKRGLPILGYALLPFKKQNVETVKWLLDEGCDPNDLYNGMTLWEWFLWTIETTEQGSMSLEFLPIMEKALLAGGNPNGRMLLAFPAPKGLATLFSRSNISLGDIKSWKLSWYPPGASNGNRMSICTILLVLVRIHQWLNSGNFRTDHDNAQWINQAVNTVQRMIRHLEERGAVKEEWKDGDSIRQIFLEVCRRIDGEEPTIQAEDAATAEQSIGAEPEDSHPNTLPVAIPVPVEFFSDDEPPLFPLGIDMTHQATVIQASRVRWYRKLGRRLKRYIEASWKWGRD